MVTTDIKTPEDAAKNFAPLKPGFSERSKIIAKARQTAFIAGAEWMKRKDQSIANDENLEKYEIQIGLAQLKEEQATIYRNTNGKIGKYWLACSPRWMNEIIKEQTGSQYEIYYWVNYGDDQTYGSFTVEQIKQWLTTPDLKLHTLGGTKER